MTLPALPFTDIRVAKVEALVFRCPIETPVRTSFGIMRDRPAVFVRVEDADGAVGWGETWCNFPSCGAEHRARLIGTVLTPLLMERTFEGPAQAFDWLTERTAILAIQSGEPGPLAQAISGVDLALWDLCARRAGQPLWRYLGGISDGVGVYASGINPDRPQDLVALRRAEGFTAFKLKIGFGEDRDLANLTALRDLLGADAPLMVDANQAWNLEEASRMLVQLHSFKLDWVEEPLRADRPWAEWEQLTSTSSIPLSAGENLLGAAALDGAIEAGVLTVLQPDVAKWGGISGCWPLLAKARAHGLRYCPHYLGAGIGLLASAHVLAAAGGDGLLEIDANPNPLRTSLAPQLTTPVKGRCTLGNAPGIGVKPDLNELAAFAVHGP